MYEFISLSVKCPTCGESLMDPSKKVDHEHGIRLHIKIKDKNGTIWLSPIYGSYNYICDIDTPKGEIAEFFCPHCHARIEEETHCKECDAPMIPFILNIGGRVSICSRSGCKNHFVEFEELSAALKMMYREYGFTGRPYPKELIEEKSDKHREKKPDEIREIIETGTFLNSYCPKCKKSLIENEMLKLKIGDPGNQEIGYLMLSPYLNVYSTKSTIFLPEDKTVNEIRCFHCESNLVEDRKSCELCGSPVAKISVGARTRLIDFYICSKKGCKWHGLSDQDLYDIKLEDSMEW